MQFIDCHVDTLLAQLLDQATNKKTSLYKNDYQLDFERMKQSNYLAQVFACFIHTGKDPIGNSYYADALKMMDNFYKEVEEHSDIIAIATDYNSYSQNKENKLMSGFLSIEEGAIIEDDLNRLEVLRSKGISFITLLWNHENQIGYPNFNWTHQDKGLKHFGIEVVEKMDDLQLVIDVSHLSDGGFYDVYKHSKKPFMATHSNARAVLNHPRNLTDDMIKKIAERGGLIGINFAGAFLTPDGMSTTESMINHINHIRDIGGEEVVGLGSDFDGIPIEGLELTGAEDMPKLFEAMEKAGMKEDIIEAISYLNFEKFLERFYENK